MVDVRAVVVKGLAQGEKYVFKRNRADVREAVVGTGGVVDAWGRWKGKGCAEEYCNGEGRHHVGYGR